MTYNALKSIDLTNFVKVLMCFLVSCSNGGDKVSPVQTMAFRRLLPIYLRGTRMDNITFVFDYISGIYT